MMETRQDEHKNSMIVTDHGVSDQDRRHLPPSKRLQGAADARKRPVRYTSVCEQGDNKADVVPCDRLRVIRSCGRYLQKIATGLISLLNGMGVTIGYFVSPNRIITQQYPENRQSLRMMERFRGHLTMIHDENNQHRCTGCGICEKACPNGTISVLTTKDLSGRRVLGRYIYRLSQCTLCNLCTESCPFGAITMGREFELAVYDRQLLTFILNKT